MDRYRSRFGTFGQRRYSFWVQGRNKQVWIDTGVDLDLVWCTNLAIAIPLAQSREIVEATECTAQSTQIYLQFAKSVQQRQSTTKLFRLHFAITAFRLHFAIYNHHAWICCLSSLPYCLLLRVPTHFIPLLLSDQVLTNEDPFICSSACHFAQ